MSINPYNCLRHTDNGKYFLGLSNTKSKRGTRFTWQGKWEKFGHVLAEKKVTS